MRKRILSVILCAALLICALIIPASAAESKKLLVLGDSIAFGSGLSNPREAVYGKIIADTNGYEYQNYAVPGHNTGNLINRMKDEAVSAAIKEADIISISIGGNNFLLGNISGLLYDGLVKEDYTRFDEIAAGFYTDLETITGTIREANPDAVIILQTIYNPQTSYVDEVYQQGAVRMNAKINEFAEAHPDGIYVADVAAALTDSDTDFAEDRIHPSAAGNEKIARVLLTLLADIGLGSKTEPVITTPGRDARGTGIFTVFVNLYGRMFHIIAAVRSLFIK